VGVVRRGLLPAERRGALRNAERLEPGIAALPRATVLVSARLTVSMADVRGWACDEKPQGGTVCSRRLSRAHGAARGRGCGVGLREAGWAN